MAPKTRDRRMSVVFYPLCYTVSYQCYASPVRHTKRSSIDKSRRYCSDHGYQLALYWPSFPIHAGKYYTAEAGVSIRPSEGSLRIPTLWFQSPQGSSTCHDSLRWLRTRLRFQRGVIQVLPQTEMRRSPRVGDASSTPSLLPLPPRDICTFLSEEC